MSRPIFINNKCAVCGNESEQITLASTNTFGSPDLDLRPPEMKRSTMCWWIQECPHCGYISESIDDETNIDKDFLQSAEYISCSGKTFASDLAKRIGIDASRLSRIENGEIQKVSDDVVLAIAQIFEVSTDFLLGVTDDPVPSNFHINELGLSVDAAKKIYSGEVDVDILNILIENKDFGTLTKMISAYFTDTTDAAIASQNQILKMVGEILGDAVDDDVLAQINLAKIQNQQNDLIAIQRGFTSILKNIKEKMNTGMKKSQKMTAEIFEQIRNNLSRGKGALPYRIITAEKMVDSVIAAMGNIGGATQEMKDDLHKALMPFFLLAAKKK